MKQHNSIASVIRTIRVVQFIGDSDKPVTFSELYDNLRIPKTTLFRILSSLQQERWIEKRGIAYTIGHGIIQLGMRALSKLELRRTAIPWVDKLSQLTGETAHLVVLSGRRGLIIEVCDGPKHIKISSRPGTFTSLHASAAGKVLLAFAVEEDLEDFFRGQSLEKRTKNTITDLEELEAEIQKVLRSGYAVDEMEYHDNVRCLAAPVNNAFGKTVAAVGITAPTLSLKKQQVESVARVVVEIADAISRNLGELKK
jgi:DNA-binding IclR family transcriptional regulator